MSFVTDRLSEFTALGNWPEAAPTVVAQINEHIPRLCGLAHDYLLRDAPEAMAECSLLVYEYYDLTLLIANLDPYNVEAEALGQKISYEPDRYPDIDRADYLIKGPDDLDKIKFRGLTSGRLPYLPRYNAAYRALAGIDPANEGCAPWSLASNLYGADRLILATMTNPNFTRELFRRLIHDFLIPLYQAFQTAIPGRVDYPLADAFASPPLLSPRLFDEYVVRSFDELTSTLPGLRFTSKGIWGLGELPEKLRPGFAESLIHVGGELLGLDPDVAKLGPQWFRDYADVRGVPLTLGLSSTLLQDGPVDQIVERVKHYVLTGKNGRTPMSLFLNCVSQSTPPDHVHAAVAAARTYGRPGADASTRFEPPRRESFAEFVSRKKADKPKGYQFKWLETSSLRL